MKFLIAVFLFFLGLNANELRDSNGNINKDFSQKMFPLNGLHKKLDLKCNDCHLENDTTKYSSAMNISCKKCHGDYSELSDYTSGLGHNNNIHASPHYEDLDCDMCHKSHKKSQNICINCHSQETMKNLIAR